VCVCVCGGRKKRLNLPTGPKADSVPDRNASRLPTTGRRARGLPGVRREGIDQDGVRHGWDYAVSRYLFPFPFPFFVLVIVIGNR
jgi:hypothetical protein